MRQTHSLMWLSIRRSLLKLTVVLSVGIWSTGCVPMRYMSGPAAKGRVVDAKSQAPIEGASVTLTRSKGSAAQTSSSKDGNFHIRSGHRWYLLNLFHPSKPIPQSTVLTIDGGSFLSFATNSAPGIKMFDVGEIRLQALSK